MHLDQDFKNVCLPLCRTVENLACYIYNDQFFVKYRFQNDIGDYLIKIINF